ncbi:MAG: 5-(carboxyamino)imidazole ribonucleotide synthase [Saprospiraceae bacterium]|nr:5-(carboxyamino)imidazole ribonucleotide synthase [Saprospiraceae bacterium]
MFYIPGDLNIGILGGGQLGRMLAQEGYSLGLELFFLDKSRDYPAGRASANFIECDITSYEDVVGFGQVLQIITIEIENVNTKGLYKLEALGILVYPQAAIIDLIKDKGNQKQFYKDHHFPTAPFRLFNSKLEIEEAIDSGALSFPFVQKLRTGGYDGKGVELIHDETFIPKLMDGHSVIETLADIKKEISVIAVRNIIGETKVYPAVSMDFHPTANLVEFVICPAEIPDDIEKKASKIAFELANKLEIVGLLAVEFFYNKDGSIWINEMAPRPHNSGHITMDNGATSQFENHLRAISGLSIGSTQHTRAAVMVNLLGEEGYAGKARYVGLDEILKIDGVHVHIYGKEETRPNRKMGHVTITDSNLERCKEIAKFVAQTIKVIS